jgi:hypothetical protein
MYETFIMAKNSNSIFKELIYGIRLFVVRSFSDILFII